MPDFINQSHTVVNIRLFPWFGDIFRNKSLCTSMVMVYDMFLEVVPDHEGVETFQSFAVLPNGLETSTLYSHCARGAIFLHPYQVWVFKVKS